MFFKCHLYFFFIIFFKQWSRFLPRVSTGSEMVGLKNAHRAGFPCPEHEKGNYCISFGEIQIISYAAVSSQRITSLAQIAAARATCCGVHQATTALSPLTRGVMVFSVTS